MKDSILLKILVVASIAIVMAVTNPDKGDFAFYANNHIKKLYPNIDPTIKKDDDNGTTIVKILGNIVIDSLIVNATSQKDYIVFSIFTVDTSLLRAIDSEQKNIKIIGIFGNFYKIN